MTVDLDNCVRIRMYRQGLGDCFLLTIPDGKQGAGSHVLIDFGVLTGTRDAEASRMRAVAKNIVEVTARNRLNLLVVTHEHWDHVSGFLQAKDVLKDRTCGSARYGWPGLRSLATISPASCAGIRSRPLKPSPRQPARCAA